MVCEEGLAMLARQFETMQGNKLKNSLIKQDLTWNIFFALCEVLDVEQSIITNANAINRLIYL